MRLEEVGTEKMKTCDLSRQKDGFRAVHFKRVGIPLNMGIENVRVKTGDSTIKTMQDFCSQKKLKKSGFVMI